MTSDAVHEPTRWTLNVPGLLLAPTGFGAALGLLAAIVRGYVEPSVGSALVLLPCIAALGWTVVAGARLLVHGTGGEQGALTSVHAALWPALLGTGLVALSALGFALLDANSSEPGWVVDVLLATWAALSFLLVSALRRAARGRGRTRLWDRTAGLLLAILPLVVLMALLIMMLALFQPRP